MDINEIAQKLTFKKFIPKKQKFGSMMFSTYDFKIGDVLKLKDKSVHLVGNVNRNLGLCDDCTNFTINDISKIANLSELF